MTDTAHQRTLPEQTARMAPFWAGAASGIFLIQRCTNCAAHRFPAVEFCSSCLSADLQWVEADGRGTLHSFVVIHHSLDPFFAERVPYIVADVKLTEGPHVITSISGCGIADVVIDMALHVAFEPVGNAVHLPVFRPAAT